MKNKIEILAPAGNFEVFKAACNAQADAIYLGLTSLNARRGAANFEPSKLAEIVKIAHENKTKVYLTLNIKLTNREVGQAFRIVQLASDCCVDAIIICDFSLFFLIPHFPNINFHLSTQAACCNEYDLALAKKLGIKRVVLARENTFEEIKIMADLQLLETEVFVQGAMCFCISGHCLISSWGGGRSGNRGACTSPCRVAWVPENSENSENNEDFTPFSMFDLNGSDFVKKLEKIGVQSLKIEGRLKNSEWVEKTVKLYRAMRDEESTEISAAELGNYTGRKICDGFLAGNSENITGKSGRIATLVENFSQSTSITIEKNEPKFSASLDFSGKKILLEMFFGENSEKVELTKSEAGKHSISLKKLTEKIIGEKFQNIDLTELRTEDFSQKVPNRFYKILITELTNFIRKMQKVEKNVQSKLSDNLRELSQIPKIFTTKENSLGKFANILRIDANHFQEFVTFSGKFSFILENATEEKLITILGQISPKKIIIALPTIFYHNEVSGLEKICEFAAKNKLKIEVNSLGGIALAKKYNCRFIGGNGLAIHNAKAGKFLQNLGCESLIFNIESSKEMLEMLSETCDFPTMINVFSYPVLMRSRVQFSQNLYDQHFVDKRNISLMMQKDNSLTFLRSKKAFSLLGIVNEKIFADNFIIDLTGLKNPTEILSQLLNKKFSEEISLFNYDRNLY